MSEPTPAGVASSVTSDVLPQGTLDAALGDYAAGQALALTDAERWPTLSHEGFARLASVRGHGAAPLWVHECGDRLDGADHEHLRLVAGDLTSRASLPQAPATSAPPWLASFLARVQRTVPRYRAIARHDGHRERSLADFAPVSREDLRRSIADFVPVDVPLDRVLEGSSSGSTGAAVVVPLHPVSTAAEVVMFRHLAARVGVEWRPAPGRLALANVVDQRAAFTYASMLTALTAVTGQAGAAMARVNLHPSAWRDVADRAAFLSAMDPQVISSSPLALLALVDLGLDLSPIVVFSGATHLTPAARLRVERAWGAPVVDVYGAREAGLVAVDLRGGRAVSEHVVLPRRVYVEILDAAGCPVPDGDRGEVTVTVDDNPYLPLVRYRTGDMAAVRRAPEPDGTVSTTLLGLEGREPLRLLTAAGTWVPSVDATQVIQAYGVAAWHLHQTSDGSVLFAALVPRDDVGRESARDAGLAVERLLGRPVETTPVYCAEDLEGGAKRRFSTDLDTGGGT